MYIFLIWNGIMYFAHDPWPHHRVCGLFVAGRQCGVHTCPELCFVSAGAWPIYRPAYCGCPTGDFLLMSVLPRGVRPEPTA